MNDYFFYFNEKIHPSYQEIKLLIETAGGKIVEKRSSMKDYLIILVDNEKEKD